MSERPPISHLGEDFERWRDNRRDEWQDMDRVQRMKRVALAVGGLAFVVFMLWANGTIEGLTFMYWLVNMGWLTG